MRILDGAAMGDKFAPGLSDFLQIINGTTPSDLDTAFFRFLNKKPQSRVDQWVTENYGFNLRNLSFQQMERAFKRYFMEAKKLERCGILELKSELMKRSLPSRVERNLNDIKRQEYNESGAKHKFSDRIKNITRGKHEK